MKAKERAPGPSEILRVEDHCYVLAASSLADDRVRVLKSGDTFAVFDRFGDIMPIGRGGQGLFHEGTRHLSRMELRLGRTRPLLLSSSVLLDDTLLAVDLTNPDIVSGGELCVPHGTVHLFRSKFLWNGSCFERLRLANYGREPIDISVSLSFEADYADLFEVRGARRAKRGRRLAPRAVPGRVVMAYAGLDGVERRTVVDWTLPRHWRAAGQTAGGVSFRGRLEAQSGTTLYVRVTCQAGGKLAQPPARSHDLAYRNAARDRALFFGRDCRIESSNRQFNEWLERSYADIHMMTTHLADGYYPYAGVPWYSTVFGRDGILTALSYLWINDKLARGVLAHLARLQAVRDDPTRDAEPGKILHEARGGEMAALGEIPFGLYFGSIDSTPLFVVLAGAYLEKTGDLVFIRRLWPHIEAALRWMRRDGDPDGDGFLEYFRRSKRGLGNQGWKDSEDSVFHAEGGLAEGPIALCEVQGYAYDAYLRAAAMARALDLPYPAAECEASARELQARFERVFWSEKLGMYALALDGAKRRCEVRASNAGHLLFTGIARPDRARRTARALVGPDFFSGWGIRTVADGEARYNPMSYHNGSVWPHDNAMIAAGFARYGLRSYALRVLSALFDASAFMDLNRLPELFCGFKKRHSEGPTLYPVACSPQAWASASPFLLLQSALGLSIDGVRGRVILKRPMLPDFIEHLRLSDVRAGAGSADILLTRSEGSVAVEALRRDGGIEIEVLE